MSYHVKPDDMAVLERTDQDSVFERWLPPGLPLLPEKLSCVRPARYGVEALHTRNFDNVFAIRTIWMIFNRKAYLENKICEERGLKGNGSQVRAWLLACAIAREGSALIGKFPSRDIAETKMHELAEQERIFGHRLPTRLIKL